MAEAARAVRDGDGEGEGDLEAASEPERRSRWGILASWGSGVVVLGALVVLVLRFGDLQRFVDLSRSARPGWLLLAVGAQALTYLCAAGVWHRVVARSGAPRRLAALLPLGVAKVFTDQAVPSGGLSGTLLVFRGLLRRGIDSDVALSALLVGMVSYYSAYLVAVLGAFVILRVEGKVGPALSYAVTVFALVTVAIPAAVLAVERLGRKNSLARLRRFPAAAALLRMVGDARGDLLRSPALYAETFAFQLAIVLFDSLTLWACFRAIGLSPDLEVVFVGFIMGSAAATLSPVPLGLGTFEGGCTAMLHLQGVAVEPALTATLLLRGFTFWLPMIPGLFLARRELRGRRHAAPGGSLPRPA